VDGDCSNAFNRPAYKVDVASMIATWPGRRCRRLRRSREHLHSHPRQV